MMLGWQNQPAILVKQSLPVGELHTILLEPVSYRYIHSSPDRVGLTSTCPIIHAQFQGRAHSKLVAGKGLKLLAGSGPYPLFCHFHQILRFCEPIVGPGQLGPKQLRIVAGVDRQTFQEERIAGRTKSPDGSANTVLVSGLAKLPPKLSLEAGIDRKSTRLNSSHANISYAVFCLK